LKGKILAVHPVLMCSDVMQSIRFYQLLGFTSQFVDDNATDNCLGHV